MASELGRKIKDSLRGMDGVITWECDIEGFCRT